MSDEGPRPAETADGPGDRSVDAGEGGPAAAPPRNRAQEQEEEQAQEQEQEEVASSDQDPDREPATGRGSARSRPPGDEVDDSPPPDADVGAAARSEPATEADPQAAGPADPGDDASSETVPEDVRRYDRFQKVDRATYERVNDFLRERTYITAREWAIARLCADFRTATGVEMTKIGENLPHLVPFMTDTYTPQAVNQARAAFEEKVRMAGATFLYGAMSGFFTADELDDLMYEVTEVAKFLLEVEGVELAVEEELEAEDRISNVMREVRHASEELRYEDVECPCCGEAFTPDPDE